MAIMYPSNIEDYNYTQSEKNFYEILRDGLSDEFNVFYSITWYTEKDGVRENSECDFLVFNPKYGYITIEVKGGVGIEKVKNEWRIFDSYKDGYRVLRRSPFRQAEESMYYFKEYYEKQFGSFYRGTYGFAVAFPFYKIKDNLGTYAPKKLIIDSADKLDNIEDKIIDIYNYWRGKYHNFLPFSAEQQVKFISLINKRISLSAAAGCLIELRERQLNELNRIQDNYIVLLSQYKQVFIVGGAGTGKTWIAIKKAIKDYEEGKKVLFICSSDLLAQYVRRKFDKYNIQCESFENQMKKIIGYNTDNSLKEGSVELIGIEKCLEKYIDNWKYDSVIVDEAQDFSAEWAQCVRHLLKKQNESDLYVFYDSNQNIYKRDFDNEFMINNPPFILNENIRNTSGIYKWTVKKTGLGKNVKPNTIEGVNPERIKISERKSAVITLETILNDLVLKENVKTKSMAVLSDVDIDKSILNGKREFGQFKFVTDGLNVQDNEIIFKTVYDYKGLEADVIVYINHLCTKNSDNMLDYVAYTRARIYLYVIELI
jgi:hypothetical protein